MILREGVKGCKDQAQMLVVGVDTVYIHYNIRPTEDDMFEYDEEQYTLREFMDKLWQDNINLSLALTEIMGGL